MLDCFQHSAVIKLEKEKVKILFLELVSSIIANFDKDNIKYFSAYDQMVSSLDESSKHELESYIVNKVHKYYKSNFYAQKEAMDDLPF